VTAAGSRALVGAAALAAFRCPPQRRLGGQQRSAPVQRIRAVLTFFAQDHASSEMVYANADLTKVEQAAEIIAFADYWNNATGADPGLLVFNSQPTTYKISSSYPAAASPDSPSPSAVKPSLSGWPPCPHQPGRPSPWPAPAATGGPACTKTRSN
jgi:hypothetical protein